MTIKKKEQEKQNNKIALIGIIAILVSAMNFLVTPWFLITLIEFGVVGITISYLINKAQNKVK